MCRESRVAKEGGVRRGSLVLICNFMAATICTSSSLALSLFLCLFQVMILLANRSISSSLGQEVARHLWHVQQQQQQHIGTLRMSQIVKAQFLYQAKARGNAWESSALDK